LFKGTFKGVTGLILKPTSGILDATSEASEGLKNLACYDIV
jgi:hypothetical protein